MIQVELLPAQYGDCIWLRYGPSADDLRHVLIDTGFQPTMQGLVQRLEADPTLNFELLVLTHIDADHIEGAVSLLESEIVTSDRIKNVWFNGWSQIVKASTGEAGLSPDDQLGALQGEYFSALVDKKAIPRNDAPIMVPDDGELPTFDFAGLKLTIVSPTRRQLRNLQTYWTKDLKGKLKPGDEKAALALLAEDGKYGPLDTLGARKVDVLVKEKFDEDGAKANGSSIAFLAEYAGRRLLLTGDAFPSVVLGSLERMVGEDESVAIDLFKLAHHGSKHNTSPELLEKVDCNHVVVSTNGKKFNHPDDQCLARVVDRYKGGGATLYFNYRTDRVEPWGEKGLRTKFKYEVVYGDDGSLLITL